MFHNQKKNELSYTPQNELHFYENALMTLIHQIVKKKKNNFIIYQFEKRLYIFLVHYIVQIRRADKNIVTGLIHRDWYNSCDGSNVYRTNLTLLQKVWYVIVDVIVDFAHHAFLWFICGNSCILLDRKLCSM